MLIIKIYDIVVNRFVFCMFNWVVSHIVCDNFDLCVSKEDLGIPGIQVPDGLAYDWIYKHLYWTDTSTNSIHMACIDDDVKPRRTMMLYNNSNPDCAKLPANSTSMEVCIDEPRALVVHPHKVRIILLLRESSYYSET